MLKNNNLFINSNDFASFTDLIYSDRKKYENTQLEEDIEIIELIKDPQFNCVTYKKLIFQIKEGDTVFCNTNQIDNLFFHLKKSKKLNNITLVTHQTDKLITESVFRKKPKCIKKWFSVNVDYKNNSLIPIPIGIASDFSLKNLTSSDFSNLNEKNYYKDEINMYINFQTNTNYRERRNLYNQFREEPWVNFDDPNLDKNVYLEKLRSSSFVLCPWGNGIDTHRFWETLYSGSIPITKKHQTYNCADKLPVLFVEDYKEINFDLLKNFMNNLDSNNFNYELLTKSYWNEIINNTETNLQSELFEEKKYETFLFKQKRNIVRILNYFFKRIKTFINKIIRKLNL